MTDTSDTALEVCKRRLLQLCQRYAYNETENNRVGGIAGKKKTFYHSHRNLDVTFFHNSPEIGKILRSRSLQFFLTYLQ